MSGSEWVVRQERAALADRLAWWVCLGLLAIAPAVLNN